MASATAKRSLPGSIGHVANELLNLLTGAKIQPKGAPVKISPLAAGYALPQAYGGAVPNKAYGIPETQPLFALPWVLFSKSGGAEAARGRALERAGTLAQHQRELAGSISALSDQQLAARLETLSRSFQRGPVADRARLELVGEIRRRGLSGPIPGGLVVFGDRPTFEQLTARVGHSGTLLPGGLLGTPAQLLDEAKRVAVLREPAPHGEVDLLPALQATNPADP